MSLPTHLRFQRWSRVLRRLLIRRRCRIEQLTPELLRESIDRAGPERFHQRTPTTAAEVELWTVHRIEQARLFFLAARIALDRRGTGAALLGPLESSIELERLRCSVCEELRLSVLDGIDVPLGLVVCALWEPSAWEPENLVLAGLGLDRSFEGRLLHVHVLLAAGDIEGAGRSLARLEQELRHATTGSCWLTRGAWHAARNEFEPALACFLVGAHEPSARGEWSHALAFALAFARGSERELERMLAVARAEPPAARSLELGRHAGALVRGWMSDSPAASAARDRALGRLLASHDVMLRSLAHELLVLVTDMDRMSP